MIFLLYEGFYFSKKTSPSIFLLLKCNILDTVINLLTLNNKYLLKIYYVQGTL